MMETYWIGMPEEEMDRLIEEAVARVEEERKENPRMPLVDYDSDADVLSIRMRSSFYKKYRESITSKNGLLHDIDEEGEIIGIHIFGAREVLSALL